MALNLKLLALSVPLVGGVIAIPLYLTSQSKASDVNSKEPARPSPEFSDKVSQRSKSVEKVTCDVSNSFISAPELEWYLKEKTEDEKLYSLVSCNNPAVKGIEDSFFGRNWKGLFPTKVLSEMLFYKTGNKFALTATISNEDGPLRTITMITFESLENRNSIRGELNDIKATHFKKRAVTIPIEGVREMTNKVYLFVDDPDQTTEDSNEA